MRYARYGKRLSEREKQVARLFLEGMTQAEIGKRLFVTRETVKTHISNIGVKVGTANRVLLALALDEARRGGGL
jgi:DNA-binding NarL/FixJ family response regulator